MIRNYSTFDKKIRAWDIEFKEMCHVESLFIEDEEVEGTRPDGTAACLYKGEFITMDSIGVQDKNEKDIFELDVVKDEEGSIGVVIFNRLGTVFCLMMNNGIEYENAWPLCEIIGTIFDDEHKDLFEKVREQLGL